MLVTCEMVPSICEAIRVMGASGEKKFKNNLVVMDKVDLEEANETVLHPSGAKFVELQPI